MKGIKEQLQAARSQQEVNQLLNRGTGYMRAHPATVRKWMRIAEQKRAEFQRNK
jgi:hypothetical protein